MTFLVLDTNIVSFFMRGHSLAGPYRRETDGYLLAISFMTVAELWEGAFRRSWGSQRLAKLDETLRAYLVLSSTPEICRLWGEIRFQRRRQPISVDDAWIAATAKAHDSPLVTHNPADFHDIAGLDLVTKA